MLKKPQSLSKRSTIAVIAPAFGFDPTRLHAATTALEKNFQVHVQGRPDLNAVHGLFAGSPERRLEELVTALLNPKVKALFSLRGGYGCATIYPELISILRKEKKRLKPKILLGYSDLTILLNGFFQDLNWVTFHGPVLTSDAFLNAHPTETKSFVHTLFQNKALGRIRTSDMQSLHPGRAMGPFVGGCLSLLVSMLGTPYELQTKDTILFIEDVQEAPYRVHRMITQLIHARALDNVRGIVFGKMHLCDPPPLRNGLEHLENWTVISAIQDALGPLLARRKIPVLYGFPGGHARPQLTFPIGPPVEVHAPSSKREKPFVYFREPGTIK